MVLDWGSPPDTHKVHAEISNLQMWCGIYTRGETETGIAFPDSVYWSNLPENIHPSEFYSWTKSTDFEELYELNIPLPVFFGEINSMPVTVVDNGDFLFYVVIDYVPPSELYNLVFAVILALLFFVALYLFIRRYLKPVELMKNRIDALEAGDLKSSIDIIGEDELASLSHSMNKLILEINKLLENKHQLLLEVSHELRSPLARMQLLLAMLPEHKNITKLKEEIGFLEGMIENLLLSDRLSMPYSKLNMDTLTTSEILNKVLDMFPNTREKIQVKNPIPDENIRIDETKFSLALRNLLDNAFKYNKKDSDIELTVSRHEDIEFQVKDFGIGISPENIQKIIQPFYQADQTVSTKGFGLGLTICKKIIESHQGRLTISSVPGEGSAFTLHLPIIKT
ncbi:MAG: HAMP domain-containing sensor histidine kinase [Candidatus Marinimicrobia bacterium]|nr:HAMP domain-containing sensor histidine kinase [Candidatus Neomarinimicrobiota bacterium]MDP6936623.1 HAMP domain-containing sensor histidine kinase [Candidatus Neomarinimicrobiota bacterium]